MRRRRQKNTLLPKMLAVAVLVNAVLLPILAQMGVFKGARTRLTEVKLVTLPPPDKKPPEPKKTPPKKRVAKARPPVHRAAARVASSRPARPNPNQPKVVASAAPAGAGNGPTIDNSGTAAPGSLPSAAPPAAPPPSAAPPSAAPPVPAPAPAPAPPAPAPPPVVTPAVLVSQPRPSLPDNLLQSDLHAVFRALFTIHPDGTADVQMLQSTGTAQLDNLAMQFARRWTWRPATLDGRPVQSFQRLRVEFDVNG